MNKDSVKRPIPNAIDENLEMMSSYDSKVLSRFLRYIIPYKKGAIVGVISVICFTMAVLSIPLLVKFAVDNAIAKNNLDLLNILFGILLFSATVHFISNYLQQRIIREKLSKRECYF